MQLALSVQYSRQAVQRLVVVIFFLSLNVVSVAKVKTFPIQDIKPGLKGKTHTVLQGNTVVELETEILGVQKNALGPGRDMVIGRLIDERTKLIGAVHGMSGSPLYVDGKLVGALSRRLGTFEKDGHCGFTPIEDMFDVQRRQGSSPRLEKNFFTELNLKEFFEKKKYEEKRSQSPSSYLSLPLSITGWNKEMEKVMAPLFELFPTFTPIAGGSSTSSSSGSSKGEENEGKPIDLKPGSPISAVLMDGDVTIAGTGTLTTIEDGKITAFGHPMLGLGPVDIPMAPAEIITILPSYYMPFKISNTGEICGTIKEDRLSAITGYLGEIPDLGTYSVKRTHEFENRPPLQGRFTKSPRLTPLVLALLTVTTVMDPQDFSDKFAMRIEGKIDFKNLPSLHLNGLYSGMGGDREYALIDQILPLFYLYSLFPNQMEALNYELRVDSVEEEQVWDIEKLILRKRRIPTKGKVDLMVRLRNSLGELREENVSIRLPEELKKGIHYVLAFSGSYVEKAEQFRKLMNGNVQTPTLLIQAFNEHSRDDVIYLQIISQSKGSYVEGKAQANLPYSVHSIINKNQSNASSFLLDPIPVWNEKQIEISGVVTGGKASSFIIK